MRRAGGKGNQPPETAMGMFDTINFEMPCPKCGETLSDFQSKDADCTLKLLDPDQVGEMHTSCDSCGHWVSLSRWPQWERRPEPRASPWTPSEVIELGFELVEERNL